MHRTRISMILAGVIVVALAIAGAGAMLSDRTESAPITTVTPVAPTATATLAPDATPAPHVPPAGSLPAMLARAPDWLGSSRLPMFEVARYANLAAASQRAGIPWPLTPTSPALGRWRASLNTLALPAILASNGLEPDWQRTYGFSLLDVDQVLAIGQAPDYVTILRGRFDDRTLHDAWASSGYQAIEVAGMTVWTLSPDDTIDLSAPASRPAMATLNNVALLPDGTLVVATKLSSLKDALKVARGKASPLAANGDVAALLTPAPLVEAFDSAVLVKGQLLEDARPAGTPAATPPAATATMSATPPPTLGKVRLALFGIPLPPGADRETSPGMVLLLRFARENDADTALTVIQRRLADGVSNVTGAPYARRVQPLALLRMPHTPVVRADLVLKRGEGDWLKLIEDRDLGFAMWTAQGS